MLSLPLPHHGVACMSGCSIRRYQLRQRDASACGSVRHVALRSGQHSRGLVTTAAATQTERSVDRSVDLPPSDGRHSGAANEARVRGRGVRSAADLKIDLAGCKKLAEQTSERVFEAGVVSSAEVRDQFVRTAIVVHKSHTLGIDSPSTQLHVIDSKCQHRHISFQLVANVLLLHWQHWHRNLYSCQRSCPMRS